jgi:hypothetical protein
MGALCAIADVEALVGAPIPDDALPRVERLIELASGIVTDACRPLPSDTTPETVTTVTATLVARQFTNPAMATSEGLTGYRVGYAAVGLVLTDADRDNLGDWGTLPAGSGAYSVLTPGAYAIGDPVEDLLAGVDYSAGWP